MIDQNIQKSRGKDNAAFNVNASRRIDFGCRSHVFAKGWKQTSSKMWVLELDLQKVISELSMVSSTACFCKFSF